MIEIAVSVIGAVATIMAVVITSRESSAKQIAVMGTRLDELTREVREHNSFGVKIASLEARLAALEATVKK